MIGKSEEFAADGAQLIPVALPTAAAPAPGGTADTATPMRLLKFFAVAIRNPPTRRAYALACGEFLGRWKGGEGRNGLRQRLIRLAGE